MRERRCNECGEGTIRPFAGPGRRLPFRDQPSVAVPDDLPIPTCDSCGAEWIDGPTAELLDARLRTGTEVFVVVESCVYEGIQRLYKVFYRNREDAEAASVRLREEHIRDKIDGLRWAIEYRSSPDYPHDRSERGLAMDIAELVEWESGRAEVRYTWQVVELSEHQAEPPAA